MLHSLSVAALSAIKIALLVSLAVCVQAIPPPTTTTDPLSIGIPVSSANSTTFSPSQDLIKAQELSSDEYKYYHGWDGKVLDPTAIGTPTAANGTLSARALGGVFLCENANWGQPCGYAVQPLNTCINLGSDWNDKISTIGPDAGTKLTVYANSDCGGAQAPVQWPGGSLNSEWNDRISSFKVFADPETEPRGVFLCENAGWTEPCGYAKQPANTCINLGSDWNDKISSIGPDQGARLYIFTARDCDYNVPNGWQIVNYPGWSSMPAGWNDAVSSFMVLYSP